jgi:predicted extracellular nuclease
MAGFTFVRTALLALGLAAAANAAAQPTDLIISEYVEGSSNNKALEIFNGTGASVDLSQYSIRSGINGAALGTGVALTGTLASGATHVIANSQSAAGLLALANQTSTSNVFGFNGDDAIVLEKTGGVVVDSLGVVGVDPGASWGTSPTITVNATLRRKADVCAGDTAVSDAFDPATQWDGFASDTFSGLGSHVVECEVPTPVLDIASVSQVEGNSGQTAFEFLVTLSVPAPAGGISFFATTSGATATEGTDFIVMSEEEFLIPEGQTTATIPIQVIADTVDEADETFTVTLLLTGGAIFGESFGVGIGTILNDDSATTELSVAAPADIIEGNSGSVAQEFTVSLGFALAADVVFTATTADGTATAGADYTALSAAQFTITAGQTSVVVPVQVLGDTIDEPNETYTLTIASSSPGVTLGTATATATILDDDLPVSEIFEIQGNGVCSPFVTPCNIAVNVTGEAVYTRTNIVTAVGTAGFTMQTPDARADADARTSNGIYVFTALAPRNDAGELLTIGDEVEVVGRAAEFFGLTQIVVNSTRDAANSVLTQSTGQALPNAVFFGEATQRGGGVAVPSKDPAALSCGALGNFECFEGMRVNMVNAAVTVSNQRFASPAGQLYAEVWISPYGERGVREKGALPGTTLTPDNSAAGVWDGNPEIFEMDADFLIPGLVDTELAGGTRFNAVGVVGFDFGDYEFWPTSLEVLNNSNEVVRPVPLPGSNELTIGSFNAFRLCDALANSTSTCAASTALETDTNRVAHQIGQISAYIRQVLRSPDVIGLQEVENIDVLQQLATQIAADGGPTYQAELIEGNDVGGIDVGYLINTARISNSVVTQLADNETWNDPQGSATAILHDRPPLLLAADFIGNGGSFRFHLINNHTRSRGGVDVSNADGERLRAKRYTQAASIAALVQGLQTDVETANVPLFVIGDHNAYQFTDGYVDVVGLIAGTYNNAENTCAPSNGVTTCKLPGGANIVSPPLVNLIDVIDVSERYSYKFTENFGAIQGSAGRDLATNQVLDHGLFNSVAQPFVTGMAFGRANVDASTQRFRTCNYTLRDAALCPQGPGSWVPTGSSDHDGFVIFISPPLPNAIFANGFETVD